MIAERARGPRSRDRWNAGVGMGASLNRKAEFLAGLSLFAGLDAAERGDLAERCQYRAAASRTRVVEQGTEGAVLFAVISGRLKIEARTGGEAVLLDVLGPGDIFGELALFANRCRAADVVALEDCELLAIDHRDLRYVIERRPSVALALLDNLARRVIQLGETVQGLSAADLPARLARRLCALADSHGTPVGEHVELDLRFSQSDWAHLSGVSREAVNRQFRAWAETGWIRIEGQRVRLLDIAALRRIADLAGLLAPV